MTFQALSEISAILKQYSVFVGSIIGRCYSWITIALIIAVSVLLSLWWTSTIK